jgi:hypothetical protein
MRGAGFLVTAILLGAAAAAQEDKPREFKVRPLAFTVDVPAGWTGEQGPTGLVAQDRQRNGFIVTREPFLHDPDTFAAAWQTLLGAAKIDAKVDRTKVSRNDAWHASWTAGDRQIDVWRVYAPDCEMLYNFSFSSVDGFDMKPIAESTLKSFKCTADKPELKFQQNAESVTTRISIRLPEGYEKERNEGFQLGGGISGGYVMTLPGYDPPHIAGRVRFHGMPADAVMPTSDRQLIPCSDTEKVLDSMWNEDATEFGQVEKKPRSRSATYSGLKGDWMEASVIAKSGLPQRWMGFVGKIKQDVVALVIIVDEREARLHKDYLKQVCSNIVVAK